jgi:hypothetical protein
MTREEFQKKAEEYGYSDSEIEELLTLHDELGAPYDDIPLLEKIVD